ncbi:hypothetical protein FB45DRAFT_1105709 [Roridomyces roridus]|uniref:Uncharacterized protein n=1 Tax=Roridomyces roridus TaxID=1738132 RepID=A0AAD7FCY4_9AGAR|nr:hypothetical protein FB45DRAFT_1105709 [Roridomyces roridus]
MQFNLALITSAILVAVSPVHGTNFVWFSGAGCTGTVVSTQDNVVAGDCTGLPNDATAKSISYSGVPGVAEFFQSGGGHDQCSGGQFLTQPAGLGNHALRGITIVILPADWIDPRTSAAGASARGVIDSQRGLMFPSCFPRKQSGNFDSPSIVPTPPAASVSSSSQNSTTKASGKRKTSANPSTPTDYDTKRRRTSDQTKMDFVGHSTASMPNVLDASSEITSKVPVPTSNDQMDVDAMSMSSESNGVTGDVHCTDDVGPTAEMQVDKILPAGTLSAKQKGKGKEKKSVAQKMTPKPKSKSKVKGKSPLGPDYEPPVGKRTSSSTSSSGRGLPLASDVQTAAGAPRIIGSHLLMSFALGPKRAFGKRDEMQGDVEALTMWFKAGERAGLEDFLWYVEEVLRRAVDGSGLGLRMGGEDREEEGESELGLVLERVSDLPRAFGEGTVGEDGNAVRVFLAGLGGGSEMGGRFAGYIRRVLEKVREGL